jgi:hypothetical protein
MLDKGEGNKTRTDDKAEGESATEDVTKCTGKGREEKKTK